MLRVLDLFSGIGGFSLGLERTGGFKTIEFCEVDPYCRAVLRKHWPGIQIYDDIKAYSGSLFSRINVVCGGFPCQPFSVAGKRRGKEDDRWLWPQMERVIREVKPEWVICENVPGIIGMELDQVIDDLEGQGYSCWPFVVPACAVGAWHRRDRLWVIANAEWSEQPRQESCDGPHGRVGRQQQPFPWDRDWESALREFRGMDDGLSYGVDRVDTLRNAIIPQIAEAIGNCILEAEGFP